MKRPEYPEEGGLKAFDTRQNCTEQFMIVIMFRRFNLAMAISEQEKS